MLATTKNMPAKEPEGGHQTHRRGFLFGLTAAAIMATSEAVRKLIQSLDHISTKEVLGIISKETGDPFLAGQHGFDKLIKSSLDVLNSIPEKKPNELFLQGTRLIKEYGYSFDFFEGDHPPYLVATAMSTINISKGWIKRHSRGDQTRETGLLMAAIGGSLARLLALEAVGHPNFLETPINNEGVSTFQIQDDVRRRSILLNNAAAQVIGVLVYNRMASLELGRYFDEWHMYSPSEVSYKEHIHSPIEQTINDISHQILKGILPRDADDFLREVAVKSRGLISELGFDQRTSGSLAHF
jgi:hypothetical protein